MWQGGQVLQSSTQPFEVTRFRTEVNLLDANGVPLPGYPLSVGIADGYSATSLWIAGTTVSVDSTTSVTLTTDATGKATLAILTTSGMVAPQLLITAPGLSYPAGQTAIPLMPAGPVHSYLSGQGTLNPTNPSGPLPQFDAAGKTLISATVGGNSLAPGVQGSRAATAAQAIQTAAGTGLGTTPPGVMGCAVSLRGPGGPRFRTLHTKEELSEELTRLRGPESGLTAIWSDLEDWTGDVWQGIQSGLLAISDFVVNTVGKVVNFTLQIGEDIVRGIQLAISGLEQAAQFIAGVFQAIEADVAAVIQWLQALFDFGAIWRTKMAFEQAILALPDYVSSLATLGQGVAQGWFTQQMSSIQAAFTKLETSLGNQSFGQQPSWQSQTSTTPIAGGASPSDFNNNVHHNWLQDKVNSGAPANSPLPGGTLSGPWSTFSSAMSGAGEDFMNALETFANTVSNLIKNPASLGSTALPGLLQTLLDLIEAALGLADGILQALLALTRVAMDSVTTMLNTTLDLGVLNTLWTWLATTAGYASDDTLTVSALLALMAAFPATVIYKRIEGVSSEPFPSQTLFKSTGGPMSAGQFAPQPLLAAIVQMLYVLPAAASDLAGPNAPYTLSAPASVDPVTCIVTFSGSGIATVQPTSSESWFQQYVLSEMNLPSAFSSAMQSKISSIFNKIQVQSVNTFSLQNLLFSGGQALSLSQASLPADLLLAGEVQTPAVTVTPASTTVAPGTTRQFSAQIGGKTSSSILWELQHPASGTINISTGLYTAPSTVDGGAVDVIVALDSSNTSQVGLALVQICAAPGSVEMLVSPNNLVLTASHSYSFQVTDPSGTPVTGGTWSLDPGAPGTLTPIGTDGAGAEYTAPSTLNSPQRVTITVAPSTGSQAATATVQLLPIATVSIAGAGSVGAGETLSLAASSSTLTAFTWTLSPTGMGTLQTEDGNSASATYTAPAAVTETTTVTVVACGLNLDPTAGAAGIALATVTLTPTGG